MDSRGLRGFRGNSGKMQGKFRGNSEGWGGGGFWRFRENLRGIQRFRIRIQEDSGGYRGIQKDSEGTLRKV